MMFGNKIGALQVIIIAFTENEGEFLFQIKQIFIIAISNANAIIIW